MLNHEHHFTKLFNGEWIAYVGLTYWLL